MKIDTRFKRNRLSAEMKRLSKKIKQLETFREQTSCCDDPTIVDKIINLRQQDLTLWRQFKDLLEDEVRH